MDLNDVAIQSAYKNFLTAQEKHNKEQIERDKVRFSPAYLEKVHVAENLLAEAKEMLEELPDSTEDFEQVKKTLMVAIADAKLHHYENVRLKYKKSKSVDKKELLTVLDGDLDTYIAISNVTQVALKAHAEGNVDAVNLLHCIKEEQVPVDVEFLPPL